MSNVVAGGFVDLQCNGGFDAVAAAGLTRPGVARLGGREVHVDDVGAVRLADGMIAGSALTMDAAVRNLAAFSGCSLGEAAAAASSAPAAVLGIEPTDGDAVVLGPGGDVVETRIGGRMAWRS